MSPDAVLDQLAGVGRLLVALDFDGVLAPLVDDPSASRPLPASADAVRRLAVVIVGVAAVEVDAVLDHEFIGARHGLLSTRDARGALCATPSGAPPTQRI